MKRRNKGFTLIELIVVVAILVLLMLMLVPRLTGFTETTADTVCHANQLNAYKIMVMEYTLGKEKFTQEAAEAAIEENLGPLEKMCPSGGKVEPIVDYRDSSKFYMTCSIHGGAEKEILGNYSGDVLKMAVEKFYNNHNGQLDSTGPNFGVKFKKEIADLYNLDINNFDFTVMPNKDGSYSVYIFDGISEMEQGSVISGTVYNYSKNQDLIGDSAGNTFTGTVKERTLTEQGKTTIYKTLDTDSVKVSSK